MSSSDLPQPTQAARYVLKTAYGCMCGCAWCGRGRAQGGQVMPKALQAPPETPRASLGPHP
eukprot:144136-Chlamydomonas_euryale.AAC.3